MPWLLAAAAVTLLSMNGTGEFAQVEVDEAATRMPLSARRRHPWLLVAVDGSSESQGPLEWALREAARREAVVVAVIVLAGPDDTAIDTGIHRTRTGRREGAAALRVLEAQVARAVAATGVRGRTRTAVLDAAVFEALAGAAGGADLVVVRDQTKTLLRPAVPRRTARHLACGA